MGNYNNILDTPIEYVKGIGPSKGETIRKELNIHTVGDLIHSYPFRYIDRTMFYTIADIRTDGDTIQLKGKLMSYEKIKGKNNRYRLQGLFKDETGTLELVWFQQINWLEKILHIGQEYIVYGRATIFNGKKSMAHPEMELISEVNTNLTKSFDPIYSSTEKMDAKGLDSKARRKFIKAILSTMTEADYPETLPDYVMQKLRICSRFQALQWIHFPLNEDQKQLAINRIKFEEFFYLQVLLLQSKMYRKHKYKSEPFPIIGASFNTFYHQNMTFELTSAQKRVIREIRVDMGKTAQMNRLLQGDVGSGKTIVALLSMLIAKDNGFQSCLMAPTEILAQQHYESITTALGDMDVRVSLLTGSIKGKARELILNELADGTLDIIIGTHALIEDTVVFKHLGLAIVDEQHRFGVAQRASLWKKNDDFTPHILVMTATPIPRTLAMTLYGDLDVSIIDELPPGRKEIKTIHQYEKDRPEVIKFMRNEIAKGRQIYVVYPLIEESEKLDLQNLQEGYEYLLQYFPMPDYQISVIHGKLKAKDKDWEMQRFVKKATQIMVATTVIEVGVNVPNASVMIIENTERFGLSQLHQLRGRVGRGAEQSYCILMTGYKLSKEARERIATMVRTNNGFEIAEADLKLRGPGDIQGTQQSGIMDFKLLNIGQDRAIMDAARNIAIRIIENDPKLEKDIHKNIKRHTIELSKKNRDWARIS
ncbi:MAG: ATP-dependent DNA helicase RecG [Chitinophagales bacterium]|nr:ATP-dependent DNA helicase RecG [Chitinophagales bacterium]